MLKIGSVVDGKYKVLNIIGQGGMSTIYLAMNEKANKQWAIKEIRKGDYQRLRLDKKEIEMMKKLKHPHLPSIVDVIEEENRLLIVMDYIEGRSLADLLEEQGAQPAEKVLSWAEQLCDVLNYLHTQTPPIIYRDMKPANIMLKPDGNLMLIDFGAAREYKADHQKDTILLGTRGYAAPEQYRADGQSDARTDIYCLGVTLFQLLTGANPHELRPIRELKPELSGGLEAILLKCTRVAQEERYYSAKELFYALSHYWEYDKKYQLEQRRKCRIFFLPVILGLCFAAAAVSFGILEIKTRSNTYEAYLLKAKNAVTKEEELRNYEHAIGLNPEDEKAYLELLQNCFLDDQKLTSGESEQLRRILNDYGNGKDTNFSMLGKNKDGYARFAYEAGITYFYKFEEKENKKNAKTYFEIAAQADSLERAQRERARRLYEISDYYYQIGQVDEAGDAFVSYADYWKDLKALAQGNLVALDNERTALVVYEELAAQVIAHAAQLCRAGVLQEDLLTQIDEIGQHLDSDFPKGQLADQKLYGEELAALSWHLEMAKRVIRSAYAEEES